MEAWGERSCLLVPLIFRGEVERLPAADREAPPASLLGAQSRAGCHPGRLGGGRHPERPSPRRTRGAGHQRRGHGPLQPPVLSRAPRGRGHPGAALRPAALVADDRHRRLKAYNDRHGHPAAMLTCAPWECCCAATRAPRSTSSPAMAAIVCQGAAQHRSTRCKLGRAAPARCRWPVTPCRWYAACNDERGSGFSWPSRKW